MVGVVPGVWSGNYSSFVAFGDWGENTSDFRTSSQSVKLIEPRPNFTVLLGDNFYDYGVRSTRDPLWGLFEDIQSSSPVFYALLGNHDYGQSIDAQSAYSYVNPAWVMPARYYYRLIPFGRTRICALFMDSYDLDEPQLNWANLVLVSDACAHPSAYRFVFTHYPIHTVGIFVGDDRVAKLYSDVRPLLETHHVHAYVCGHEHDMQAFSQNGVDYLIAGAFSNKYQRDANYSDNPYLTFRSDNQNGYLIFSQVMYDSLSYRFVYSNNGAILHSDQIYLVRNWTPSGPVAVKGHRSYWGGAPLVSLITLFFLICPYASIVH